MQRPDKEERSKKHVAEILARLRDGIVIVEGKHDIDVLRRFGIGAHTFESVMRGARLEGPDKTVYLFTDSDTAGEEKAEKLMSALLERNKNYRINRDLGRHLLSMLNVTSVEQIYGPIEEIMEK